VSLRLNNSTLAADDRTLTAQRDISTSSPGGDISVCATVQ
jgi:hypothetical protein